MRHTETYERNPYDPETDAETLHVGFYLEDGKREGVLVKLTDAFGTCMATMVLEPGNAEAIGLKLIAAAKLVGTDADTATVLR